MHVCVYVCGGGVWVGGGHVCTCGYVWGGGGGVPTYVGTCTCGICSYSMRVNIYFFYTLRYKYRINMTEGDDMPITMSSGSGSGILVNYTIEVSSIICACGIYSSNGRV